MTVNPHDYMTEDDPSKQGEANKQNALVWIYLWGYSTAPLLQLLLRHKGMSWTAAATRNGWLRKTGMTARDRVKVVTLTAKGVCWVEERMDKLFKYSELDPHRIAPQTIWHNMLTQRMTILAAISGEVVAYRTERQEAARSVRGAKKPDVVWFNKDRQRIGVEIELNAKWDRRFDEFVSSTITALSPSTDGAPARYQQFLVVTTSPAIASRYAAAFEPGTPLRIWRNVSKSKFVVDRTIEVPDWVRDRIAFRVVKESGEARTTTN